MSTLLDPEQSASSTSEITPSTTIPLASLLCYGCLLVYQGIQQSSTSRGSVAAVQLPSYVQESARERWEDQGHSVSWERTDGAIMREVVDEYLIKDE